MIEFVNLQCLILSFHTGEKGSPEQTSNFPETAQLLLRKVSLEPELPVGLASLS